MRRVIKLTDQIYRCDGMGYSTRKDGNKVTVFLVKLSQNGSALHVKSGTFGLTSW